MATSLHRRPQGCLAARTRWSRCSAGVMIVSHRKLFIAFVVAFACACAHPTNPKSSQSNVAQRIRTEAVSETDGQSIVTSLGRWRNLEPLEDITVSVLPAHMFDAAVASTSSTQ